MAKIDLKNATLKLMDGGSNTVASTGTVTGINAIGATVLAGTYSATPVADGYATINGRRYKIVSGSTTSITIASPGLLEATAAADPVSCSAAVKEITIKVGDGTLTYSEKRNIEYTLDRGKLDEVREGDEVPMDVKFDLVWDYISGPASGTPTVEDALKKKGLASTWTSSDTDACKPYALDIVITYVPACTGDQEEITLPDFRYEALDHDIKAGTISCTGKCNATKAVTLRG